MDQQNDNKTTKHWKSSVQPKQQNIEKQASSQRDRRKRGVKSPKDKSATDGFDRKQHHMQNEMVQQFMGQKVSRQMMVVEPLPTPPRPEAVSQSPKVRPNN